MEAPVPLSELPADPTKLELSIIADSVAKNYATAFQTRVQLEELQSWLKQQLLLYNTLITTKP
jgi:hypothetical protein